MYSEEQIQLLDGILLHLLNANRRSTLHFITREFSTPDKRNNTSIKNALDVLENLDYLQRKYTNSSRIITLTFQGENFIRNGGFRNENKTQKKLDNNSFTKLDSYLNISREEFSLKLEDRISIGKDMLNRELNTDIEVQKLEQELWIWDSYNVEFVKRSFTPAESEYYVEISNPIPSYETIMHAVKPITSILSTIESAHNEIRDRLAILERLKNKIELIPVKLISKDEFVNLKSDRNNPENKKVFIVHGHNENILLEVANMVRSIGLIPIILHEQANQGLTIIEKFEKYSDVGFAIILLTDDDEGRIKTSNNFNKRARQNVVFEMGYFIALLSRASVCMLYTSGVELPSDLSGLLYTELDSGDCWKKQLTREFTAAGYKIESGT
jgi:predicted nucleotide-binding protein